MHRRTALLIVAGLALAAAGSSAARTQGSFAFQGWTGGSVMMDTLTGDSGHHKGCVWRGLSKYTVRPTLRKDFVPQLLKVKEEAGQQDGFRAIQFHLSVNDNERFIGYWEWDSIEKLMQYLERDGTEFRNLVNYNNQNDVRAELEELKSAKMSRGGGGHGHGHHYHQHHRHSEMQIVKDEPQATALGLMVSYFMKPSRADKLIKTFEDVLDKAQEEEGINRYGLHVASQTNAELIMYSEYDGEDALSSHLQRGYIQDLAAFLQEKDIVFKSNMLVPIDQIKPWQ